MLSMLAVLYALVLPPASECPVGFTLDPVDYTYDVMVRADRNGDGYVCGPDRVLNCDRCPRVFMDNRVRRGRGL